MKRILIASSKPWFIKKTNLKNDDQREFVYITKKSHLNIVALKKLQPDFIFFPHWSFKIPKAIYNSFKCIIFHTAPLPTGRGGSPIQNLILNGQKDAPVCALDVVEQIDAGAIYLEDIISLSGSLDQIFDRLAGAIDKQIDFICDNKVEPIPQTGSPTYFNRLDISDNELPNQCSIQNFYDRVRMVDADDYPNAYLSFGNFKIEFRGATYHGGKITAEAKITER